MTLTELHDAIGELLISQPDLGDFYIGYYTTGKFIEPQYLVFPPATRMAVLVPSLAQQTMIAIHCQGGDN